MTKKDLKALEIGRAFQELDDIGIPTAIVTRRSGWSIDVAWGDFRFSKSDMERLAYSCHNNDDVAQMIRAAIKVIHSKIRARINTSGATKKKK